MKTRFNSYDIVCITAELQRLVGLRVNQIYDIDNKTYLIKLQDKDVKETLLFESGVRFHTTSFEWPKNPSPSGFTMKLRKHLKNKRLESLTQMGSDRIIDFQFGVGEATYHLILELYDRGNVILCDHEMTILNLLRPHTEGEAVRFVVREKYPEARARSNVDRPNSEIVREVLDAVQAEDSLKKILTPILDCGPTVLTHVLMKYDLNDCRVKKKGDAGAVAEEEVIVDKPKTKKTKNKAKGGDNKAVMYFDESRDFDLLVNALNEADSIMRNIDRKEGEPHGYIIQKTEIKPATEEGAEPEEFRYNIEYHPYLFEQYRNFKYKEFELFDTAVDEFYSTLIGQKIDIKTYQQECEALKKLSNVKKDHEKRLEELNKVQILNKQRAELITRNRELVDSVLVTIRSAIANQMSWSDINEFVKNAQLAGDFVAKSIKQLKLETNHVSLYLADPYAAADESSESDSEQPKNSKQKSEDLPPMIVDIDLGLSAYANATRYYDQKRTAAQKENRTIESSAKALKNAEKRTQEHLKEVRTISNISKARKVFWFEKFFWFISSENYLVIGGRDQQQNELIVKRYLRNNDIYVHADIQGASSIVIRNPFTGTSTDPQATPPPKTLLEAGAMAISYSVAWDAKVTTSAYWVRSDQVSKTAPTGEYLETGSFMIRGKKNFLPPCHLILGLSIMFKLEESSVARHAGERCVRKFDNLNDKKYELHSEEQEEINVEIPVDNDGAEKSDESEPNVDDADDDDGVEELDSVRFPDTHIKIGSLATQISSESTVDKNEHANDDVEEGAIIHAVAQQMPRKNRVIQKSKEKHGSKKKQQQQQQKQATNNEQNEEKQPEKQKSGNSLKRGQKSKLKKIKEKYKDQDEEEKLMRMEILKSAGNKKNELVKVEKDEILINRAEQRNFPKEKKPQYEKKPAAETAPIDVDDDDGAADAGDADLLNSLTGCPSEEDELLFALPVVAPYNALQNYKYKVKITPGTARRGKTSKTALMMFLKEKSCTSQEKDFLKAIKHDAAARNMPGKVKLSAPQMQRLRN